MGFFFRKSFKLGPARLSLSKSGPSISTGVKGARVGLGAKGAYLAAGGATGLFYRARIGGRRADSGEPEMSTVGALIILATLLAMGILIVAALGFVV